MTRRLTVPVICLVLAPMLLASATLAAPAAGVTDVSLEAPAVAVGGSLKGTVIVTNDGTSPLELRRVVLAARPPGGTPAGGPYLDFGSIYSVSLAPGESRTFTFTKTFGADAPRGEWFAYGTAQHADGSWRNGPERIAFFVGDAGTTFSKAAEAFATRSLGGATKRADYWGGSAYSMWTNGVVEDSFTPAASDTYRVSVTASGSSAAGVSPRMVLRVNGADVGAWSVDPTRVGTFDALVHLPAGAHARIGVAFTNDYYDSATRADRNLHVDHVVVRRDVAPVVGTSATAVLDGSSVAVGGSLSGTVTVTNTGTESTTLKRVVLAARPPGGTESGGPYMDFGSAYNVALAPGQSKSFRFTKAFGADAPTGEWFAFGTAQWADGTWHDGTTRATFSVQAAPAPEPAAGVALRLVSDGVPRYGRAEAVLDFPFASWANPFDPRHVDVQATITTPSGRIESVPGFWFQDYTRTITNGEEHIKPAGDPHFRVRYGAREVGVHTMHVSVDGWAVDGPLASHTASFTVTASADDGFIGVSSDRRGFVASDGSPFVPVGMNLGWPDLSKNGGASAYEYYFERFEPHGMNWARLWLADWGLGLEWTKGERGFEGLGRYHTGNAWRLDKVLESAEARGVKVQIAAYSYNPFDTTAANPKWGVSPWNRANGGPLSQPADMFSDPTAMRYSENLMRYLAARYGASDAVFAWELWNEVSNVDGYTDASAASAAWHDRMARTLRANDPAHHPVTTSFAWPVDPAVNALSTMDFVQVHTYDRSDAATMVTEAALAAEETWGKPSFTGEFAESSQGWSTSDSQGRYLHRALWASAVGTGRGSAMTWWWDRYVDDQDIYGRYGAVTRFLDGLPALSPSDGNVSVTSSERGTVVSRPGLLWEKSWLTDFDVQKDGRVVGLHGASEYVFGSAHPDLKDSLTFRTGFDRDTPMAIEVAGAHSSGARLVVKVDGRAVRDVAVTGAGTHWVTVPASGHTVTIENTGVQWWRLYSVEFHDTSRARVFASQSSTAVAAWVQDVTSANGANAAYGSIASAKLSVEGLRDGQYRVEWWDTWSGKATSTTTVSVSDGRATFGVPTFTGDVALRMTRS